MNTAIITGGNRGLGYECAKSIGKMRDWRLLIACRDPQKAETEIATLRQQTGNSNIIAMKLDLASLISIDSFINEVQFSNWYPITTLICNAGLQIVSETQYTQDGFEMTFGVNHLGHYLLVNRLLENMARPGRILFVSSGTHDPKMKTGMPEPEYTNARLLTFPPKLASQDPTTLGRKRYTTSKLANIFTTYEMTRRLKRAGKDAITVNAFDPGMMPGTGLARDYNPLMRLAWKFVLPMLTYIRPGVNRVEVSGANLAYLATNPELENVTGKYFVGRKSVPSSLESYDEDKAYELWETSKDLVGLERTI